MKGRLSSEIGYTDTDAGNEQIQFLPASIFQSWEEHVDFVFQYLAPGDMVFIANTLEDLRHFDNRKIQRRRASP